MPEHNKGNDTGYWFGVPPVDVHPSQPYQLKHREALKRGADRGLSSYLGQMVERSVISIWGHTEVTEVTRGEELGRFAEEIRTALEKRIGVKRMKAEELSTPYNSFFDDFRVRLFFWQIEDVLKVLSNGDSIQAIKETANTANHKRYVIETALMIAKEVARPSLSLNRGLAIVPSLSVGGKDVIFDGVVVHTKYLHGDFSFEDIQRDNIPWGIIETKAVYQTWRVTGGINSLSHPPQAFTKRLRNQLVLAENWVDSNLGGVRFNYPGFVRLVCLRGVFPSRVFEENDVNGHLHSK